MAVVAVAVVVSAVAEAVTKLYREFVIDKLFQKLPLGLPGQGSF